MKAFILTLCLFISFELVAQECEFDVNVLSLDSNEWYDNGTYINADNVKLIEDSNFFYILNFSKPAKSNYRGFYLRIRKYSKCGNILLDEKQQTISDGKHYKIIITQGLSSNWNICLIDDSATMYEMDTNCNLRKLFFINGNKVSINDFIRVNSNQFIFVGHQKGRASAFSSDTLGNTTWQILDSTSGGANSYYNQIQKGNDHNIYLLGSKNNKFTKSALDTNGTVSNTIYWETGTTHILDSLNYGLTFSQNGQYIYSHKQLSVTQ